MCVNLANKPAIPAHVMAREVGDETVLLDIDGATYFGLDPIGARVWQLMGEGMSLGAIEYNVNCDALQRDILGLSCELPGQKLISI
jgi:hypothetical protein